MAAQPIFASLSRRFDFRTLLIKLRNGLLSAINRHGLV